MSEATAGLRQFSLVTVRDSHGFELPGIEVLVSLSGPFRDTERAAARDRNVGLWQPSRSGADARLRNGPGHHAVVRRIEVEVFPVEHDRWIAVIGAPLGPFSTEAVTPEDVEQKVCEGIAEVLGWTDVDVLYMDDFGQPWSPSRAADQAARMLHL